MANTYVSIASNTLTGTAASVTFSNIPQTFTDLILISSMRINQSGTSFARFYIQYNNSLTLNYASTILYGAGASTGSNSLNNVKAIYSSYTYSTNSTPSTNFGNVEIYIPNYTSSAIKQGYSFGAATTYADTTATLCRLTAPVTSITLYAADPDIGGDTFATGSSFYLYGI